MKKLVSDIAFSPAVKQAQERLGSRKAYENVEKRGSWQNTITDDLAQFIGERDTFYLGTANSEGQPYIQHRGGPKGFLKVLDEKTLGFADYGGNRQYITVGTLTENDKAYIFLMDYPNRRRIKIWGRAEVVENDPELIEKLKDPNYKAKIERAILFRVTAWDVNCPQHIVKRYTEDEMAPIFEEFKQRIAKLEEENQKLQQQISKNRN